MAIRLVNTAPGDLADAFVPGNPVYLGLKSESDNIELGTFRVTTGLSRLAFGSYLPELDPKLSYLGATVAYETSERRRPISSQATVSLVSSQLHIQKNDNSDNNLCVYELKFPIETGASLLGYIKFRTGSWTVFNPDWLNLTDMTGVYLGLEHGTFNTACYAFLRNVPLSDGSLVIGGPLPSFAGARPAQQEFAAFDWAALPLNSQIEVWIYFNAHGYPPPFATPYVPLVEVWTRRIGIDPAPVAHAKIPVGSFGQFPSSGMYNFRPGPSNYATMYFGMPGRTGDLLRIDDFILFPDFGLQVNEGVVLPGNRLTVLPDAPVSYRADRGKKPGEIIPGRWMPTRDPTQYGPVDFLKYRFGQDKTPRHLFMTKDVKGRTAFYKKEPRVEATAPVSSLDGCMVEAFMSGSAELLDGELFGAGLGVDDGQKFYQVLMIDNPTTKTYGLVKDQANITSTAYGHYLPAENVDYRTMKLVRLVVDRRRGRVAVDVDEQRVIDRPITDPFPATENAVGKVLFGHIYSGDTKGRFDVKFLNYLTRYLAYESSDNILPSAATPAFTQQVSDVGGNFVVSVADGLQITKATFGTPTSKRYFEKLHDLYDAGGVMVDFKAYVRDFTDENGTPFSPASSTGSGVRLFFGNKRLELLFVNCGVGGKRVAIVPGTGTINDILNQTDLGKSFSAPVDWTQETLYRLVYRAYDKIEVWASSVVNEPIISIPWRNDTEGFDLPSDATTPRIAFGHFDENASSTTFWRYFRWGNSNGYEVAIEKPMDEYPRYLFGGRIFSIVKVEE